MCLNTKERVLFMKKRICFTGLFFVLFVGWTISVSFIDRNAIGPKGTVVGFSGLNKYFADIVGVNLTLYTITDILSIIPIAFAFGFAILGVFKLIKNKSIKKVDKSLLILGGFYVTLGAVYLLFEKVVINFRPILIEGNLEGSYPSSTTLLVLCIMPTVAFELFGRIKNNTLKKILVLLIFIFTIFMVIGRILSGVHWLSDIIGGVLCSCFLVFSYFTALYCVRLQK